MKSFLRENPTIAFGLGLPLLLVVVFLLVSGIPVLLVEPPQHEVLYATEYYNYQNGVQISVIDRTVRVFHRGGEQTGRAPRLWRFDPKTGAVKEIAFIVPPGTEEGQTIVIDVPDLAGVTVDSSSVAPDGYEFRLGNERYAGNIFGELFYSSRYRHEAVLSKNGRSIRLPNAADRYYSSSTHFVGWVVPQ